MTDSDENMGVPCCTLKATMGMTKIRVASNLIGVIEFNRIMEDVKAMDLADDDLLKTHLLRQMKRYNYIPANFEEEYAIALLLEYKKRTEGSMS